MYCACRYKYVTPTFDQFTDKLFSLPSWGISFPSCGIRYNSKLPTFAEVANRESIHRMANDHVGYVCLSKLPEYIRNKFKYEENETTVLSVLEISMPNPIERMKTTYNVFCIHDKCRKK